MDGYERLKVLHGVFHPEGSVSAFPGNGLPQSAFPQRTLSPRPPLTSAKASFAWAGNRRGELPANPRAGTVDRMLADFHGSGRHHRQLHIRRIDQTKAIKTIKRKSPTLTDED